MRNNVYYGEWTDKFWVDTWFERDRAYVILYYGEENDPSNSQTIKEWWDEDVSQAIEDGFLKSKDWRGSAIAYCKSVGMI